MRLWLPELQDKDEKAKTLKAVGLPENWEDVKRVLKYRDLLYVPEIIRYKVISCHHNNPLAEHFGIDQTKELVSRKYYWPSRKKDVKKYVRGYDICLALKAVCHKPYRDL